ncbi:hypothetical protein ZWY2020_041728 [Hordeum vulgare]|nr:hypothetical protein ZWY2020_041728 [Hordeum vulgare]
MQKYNFQDCPSELPSSCYGITATSLWSLAGYDGSSDVSVSDRRSSPAAASSCRTMWLDERHGGDLSGEKRRPEPDAPAGPLPHYPAIPLLPSRPLAESASIVAAAPASPNASLSCTSTPASPRLEPASLHPSSTSASYLALRVPAVASLRLHIRPRVEPNYLRSHGLAALALRVETPHCAGPEEVDERLEPGEAVEGEPDLDPIQGATGRRCSASKRLRRPEGLAGEARGGGGCWRELRRREAAAQGEAGRAGRRRRQGGAAARGGRAPEDAGLGATASAARRRRDPAWIEAGDRREERGGGAGSRSGAARGCGR